MSRCGDFTISPEVVPLGGTFTVSIDYTSDGSAPCNASACVGCGVFGNLQTIDGAPAADPLDACGLTPGTHTAVVKATFGPVCGAACHFGEPGNWGTTHYFIIGE